MSETKTVHVGTAWITLHSSGTREEKSIESQVRDAISYLSWKFTDDRNSVYRKYRESLRFYDPRMHSYSLRRTGRTDADLVEVDVFDDFTPNAYDNCIRIKLGQAWPETRE